MSKVTARSSLEHAIQILRARATELRNPHGPALGLISRELRATYIEILDAEVSELEALLGTTLPGEG